MEKKKKYISCNSNCSFPLKRSFFLPITLGLHYFKPAPDIGRTSLSKYLISNVTIASCLVFTVVVLMKDFIFPNKANKG